MARPSLGSFALSANRVDTRPIRGPGFAYRYKGSLRALAAAAVVGAVLLLPAMGGTAQAGLTATPWGPVAANPFTALSGVSSVSVVNSAPSPGAGARTRYVVDFNVSASGAMSGAAGDEVTV